MSARFKKFMWLEDLIMLVENTIMQETDMKGAKSAAPMESILDQLATQFKALKELSWYSLTVENISQGYSLFATMTSEEKL